MSNLTFSVVIPTFKRYHLNLLSQAIESVLNQETGKYSFELIIVDDATPEFSEQLLLDKFKDSRIKVVTLIKNLGTPGAIKEGIKTSRGQFVVILGDDDLLPKNSLKLRAKYIQNNPDIDWFYGKTQLINAKGKPISTLSQSECFDDFHYPRMFLYNYIQGGTTTVKRNVYEKIEWPTWLKTRDDDFIAFELVKPGKFKFGFLDEVVYCYRTHNLVERESEKNLRNRLQLDEIDQKIRYELQDRNLAFLADLARKAALLEIELKDREYRLERIYNSMLWKASKPLRDLKNWMKRW